MKNQWTTAKAYLSHLNWDKTSNYFKLLLSFYWSRAVKKPIIWGMPSTLSIEPTTSCNLRCPECPSGLRNFSRPTGMLDKRLFYNIIEQSRKHLTYLHLYFQGEPYLHPQFTDLISYANRAGVFTSTSTNAHFLTPKNVEKTIESGLKQLIVSMDGITQEVYENYRIGGKLAKVQEGLSLLIGTRNAKKRAYPKVILQFLVTGKNEHQIPELKSWAKKMGVDELQLKSTQIYNYENGSSLIPSDPRYSRYVQAKDGKWKLKKEIENKCWRMWQGSVLTWDGKLVPCCFDKDAKHVMGDLKESNLSDIWRGKKYHTFRQQLLQDRKQIEICKNCTE
ncbi:putative Fe-S oxidoreductase, SAM radical superfamily [Indibacter alkaliphilus LW1]|uniref:Fe-S oxidoreductase, SAM radical superfamily n=1 Tax=Indibacter alkaliphilus (strain CCUG 57479 / KCTC 22604 / LW1) TaxID=1189612 RepID=S2D4Q1_INDAL|nr:radical SAM/SPASM domain-containing protein [Indibacter alkaliphilus]EOZ92025.1 putative Fe-S oxidoreductase, SAM radical superfamily [Indibacter alkaliphilus LW1]